VNFQTLVKHLTGQGSRLTHQFGGQAYVIHPPTLTRRGDERRRKGAPRFDKLSAQPRLRPEPAEGCSALRQAQRAADMRPLSRPKGAPPSMLSAQLRCALSPSKGTCDSTRRSYEVADADLPSLIQVSTTVSGFSEMLSMP
jgi:hypothetical protein